MSFSLQSFLKQIIALSLVKSSDIDSIRLELDKSGKGEDPKRWMEELNSRKLLTKYQISTLLRGDANELRLGNYKLVDKIGKGGWGTVYRASHVWMERDVAIKILHASIAEQDESLQRFQREIRVTALLDHPNIVRAYDADREGNRIYLVMEYVDGTDLATKIARDGPLSPSSAVAAIAQAARGLYAAHQHGIVHRDVKPANLLMNREGIVKVLDLGIARLTEELADQPKDEGLTRDHHIVGTIEFMAPEQADESKSVDYRADIYSLGCTLFFLLTGSSPFSRGSILQTLAAHKVDRIPWGENANVPRKLRDVVAKMLEKQPSDRYNDMQEVVATLEGLLDKSDDFTVARNSTDAAQSTTATRDFEFDFTNVLEPPVKGESSILLDMEVNNLVQNESGILANLDAKSNLGGLAGSTLQSLSNEFIAIKLSSAEIDFVVTPSGAQPISADGIISAEVCSDVTSAPALLHVPAEQKSSAATLSEIEWETSLRALGTSHQRDDLSTDKVPPEVSWAVQLRELAIHRSWPRFTMENSICVVPTSMSTRVRHGYRELFRLLDNPSIQLISSTVAYAMAAWMLDRSNERKLRGIRKNPFLVIHFDGLTFQASVFKLTSRSIEALSHDGDSTLGVIEFEQKMLDLLVSRFSAKIKEPIHLDEASREKWRKRARDVTKRFADHNRLLVPLQWKAIRDQIAVSREDFHNEVMDLLGRIEFLIEEAIAEANIPRAQIGDVILAGRGFTLPGIRESVEALVGLKKTFHTFSKSLATRGAIWALLSQQADIARSKLIPTICDLTNSRIGIVVGAGKTSRKVATLFRRRNTTPASISKSLRWTPKSREHLLVTIVEGEGIEEDSCTLIGRYAISGFGNQNVAEVPITIAVDIDASHCLTVQAMRTDSGQPLVVSPVD